MCTLACTTRFLRSQDVLFWCGIPFLFKENWHELKDHGLVCVEIITVNYNWPENCNIEPSLLNFTDINLKFVEDKKCPKWNEERKL